jgi:hypothetical protein
MKITQIKVIFTKLIINNIDNLQLDWIVKQ